MKEYIISEENAQKQLDLFFEWYDLDYKEDLLGPFTDQGVQGALLGQIRILIKAIRRGNVVIEESSSGKGPTLTIKQVLNRPVDSVKEIIYSEVTGLAHVAMRPSKNASEQARLFDFLGILSGQKIEVFCGLTSGDLRTANAVGFLLSAV